MSAERCSARIWSGFDDYPCPRAGKVDRDGKRFCGMHDPERIAARREASHAAWEAKLAAEQAARDKESREREAGREAVALLRDLRDRKLDEYDARIAAILAKHDGSAP